MCKYRYDNQETTTTPIGKHEKPQSVMRSKGAPHRPPAPDKRSCKKK